MIAGIQLWYADVHFWKPAQHLGNINKHFLPHKCDHSVSSVEFCLNMLKYNLDYICLETSYRGDERQTTDQPNIEDRATQPMEAGG